MFSLSSPGQTDESSTWMAHVLHWEGMCSVYCSGANCQVFELRCTYDPVEQTAKLSNSDVRAIQQQLKIQDQPVDFMCTDTLFQHPLGYKNTVPCFHLTSYLLHASSCADRHDPAMHPEVPHDGNPSHGLPLAMDGNLLVLHSTKLPRTGHGPGTPAPSTGFILHGLHAVRAIYFMLHASYFIPARHAVQPPHRHPTPPGVLPFLLLSSISSCVRPCRCVFRTVRLVSFSPFISTVVIFFNKTSVWPGPRPYHGAHAFYLPCAGLLHSLYTRKRYHAHYPIILLHTTENAPTVYCTHLH